MKWSKINLLVILFLSLSIISSCKQERTIDSSQPTNIVRDGGESTFEKPAPDVIIKKADDYIANLLGEEYFKAHFLLEESAKEINTFYGYHVYYKVKTPLGDLQIAGINFDKKGDIVEYRGPKKPYQFLITKEKAIKIAKEAVVQNPTQIIIEYLEYVPKFGPVIQGDTQEKIEDVVLIVSGSPKPPFLTSLLSSILKVLGFPTTMGPVSVQYAFLDVDTGKVLASLVDTGAR